MPFCFYLLRLLTLLSLGFKFRACVGASSVRARFCYYILFIIYASLCIKTKSPQSLPSKNANDGTPPDSSAGGPSYYAAIVHTTFTI